LGKAIDYSDSVPSVFFDDNFEINKQVYFDKIVKEQHEDLVQYLDKVETTLLRKTSFYAVQANDILTQYRQFRDEWSRTMLMSQMLRNQLKSFHAQEVIEPLRIMRMIQERHNLEQFEKKLGCLSTIAKTPSIVQSLILKNDFIAASELVEQAKLVLHSELVGIHTFKKYSDMFNELGNVIVRACEVTLVTTLVNNNSNNNNSNNNSNTPTSPSTTSTTSIESTISTLISPLVKWNRFMQTLQNYSDTLISNIKDIIINVICTFMEQQHLQITVKENNNTSNSNSNSSPFYQRIISLSHVHFIQLINIIYTSIHQRLVNTIKTHALIQQVESSTSTSTFLHRILEQYYDEMNNRISQLLRDREHLYKKLTREQLDELVLKSNEFITSMNNTMNSNSNTSNNNSNSNSNNSVQATLLSIVILYVEDFHSKQTEQLQVLLQNDTFDYKGKIPLVFQAIIQQFENNSNSNELQQQQQQDEMDTLVMKGKKFKPSNCLLILIKMVSEYFEFTKFNFVQKYDVASRLFRLLSTFINQISDRFFGINVKADDTTSKRFYSAAESVYFTSNFVPLIKKKLETILTEPNHQSFLSNFDILNKECFELHSKLHNMTFDIAKNKVLDKFMTNWAKYDFENAPPPSSPSPQQQPAAAALFQHCTAPMKTLTSSLTRLYQSMEENIAEQTLAHNLFIGLMTMYTEYIRRTLEKIVAKSKKAKQRIWEDIYHFQKFIQQWDSILANHVNYAPILDYGTQKFGPYTL